MSQLIFGHDAEVLEWALQRQPEGLATQNAWVLGIWRDGALRGAIAICQNSPTGVTIGVEADCCLDRQVIRGTFAFIFEHLGASRCEIVTKRTNKTIKKHAPNLFGFRFEGVRRDWYGPGQDGLAFYMTPATCKWIESNGISLAA